MSNSFQLSFDDVTPIFISHNTQAEAGYPLTNVVRGRPTGGSLPSSSVEELTLKRDDGNSSGA